MTIGQLLVSSSFLDTLLFSLLLWLRPWRKSHPPKYNDLLAWRMMDILVGMALLVIGSMLVFMLLNITMWVNPNVPPDQIYVTDDASYVFLYAPLAGIGWLLVWQLRFRLRQRSN